MKKIFKILLSIILCIVIAIIHSMILVSFEVKSGGGLHYLTLLLVFVIFMRPAWNYINKK